MALLEASSIFFVCSRPKRLRLCISISSPEEEVQEKLQCYILFCPSMAQAFMALNYFLIHHFVVETKIDYLPFDFTEKENKKSRF